MMKVTYSWAVVLVCAMLIFLACQESIEEDVVPINQNDDQNNDENDDDPPRRTV